jgi:hypothetical protein
VFNAAGQGGFTAVGAGNGALIRGTMNAAGFSVFGAQITGTATGIFKATSAGVFAAFNPMQLPYPHPPFHAGCNSVAISHDEVDGIGYNEEPYATPPWEDITMSRPTLLGLATNPDPAVPNEKGQSVDIRIARERHSFVLPSDRNRLRAVGLKGTVDK